MKQAAMIFILLMVAAVAEAHPLHLSVTNITYENGMLEISMKTFRDDWETAYFHYHSRVIDFSEPANRALPWFREYLESCFQITAGAEGDSLEMRVDSILLDENSMHIEMHAEVPGKPNSLYIYNALLTDIYPDQTNLVILGYKDRETGMKFDVRKHGEVVTL
jgi:hypothetical protein